MRAVLDTNVLVAALLSRDGTPAALLRAWRAGAFDLVVSPTLLEELVRVLEYPMIAARVTATEREEFVGLLKEHAIRTADSVQASAIRSSDPADDYLISLAKTAQALLVSGDGDLLDLAAVAPIMSPAAFLELLRDL